MEEGKRITPIKAIRLKCLECCADSSLEVKLCDLKRCSLHKFRLGRNPNINRKAMSDEQREACRERLAKARENRLQNDNE
jgi:hypothetical protein